MVAAVVRPGDGAFLAVHQTFLERRDGAWRKSSEGPAKKILGRCRGGVIALTRGASGLPLPQAPEGDGVLLAEGIENALSASLLRPELRALAVVAVNNLAAVQLPPPIRRVVLVRDRDGDNRGVAGIRAGAIQGWLDEGRQVEVLDPPPRWKDLNDVRQASVAGGAAAAGDAAAWSRLTPAEVLRATVPLEAGALGADLVEELAGVGLACLPALPGLGLHPGLAFPDAPGIWPALVGAVVSPAGEILGLASWPLPAEQVPGSRPMPIARPIGAWAGGAVPVTEPHRNGTVILAAGLGPALKLAARRPAAQVWLVPTAAQLATVALPSHIRRVVVLPPADDPSFGDVAFLQRAEQALARPGRTVVVPKMETDGDG